MEFTLPLSSIDSQTSTSYKNWQHMKQRFKDHFSLEHKEQNHSKSSVASLLMFFNGDKIRGIMKSFSVCADDKFSLLDSVFENIEDLCLPGFILLYDRFRFCSLRQKRFEDLSQFVSKLQILADFCELREQRQKYVTNRIVDGVCSESLRKHLRRVSDLELETALDICEKAQRVRKDKCVDVTCQEISGKAEVLRRKPHAENKKRKIVNGKSGNIRKISSVNRKKSDVRKKKTSTREKRGRQGSASGDNLPQQTGKMETKSDRSMRSRTTNLGIFKETDHSIEAASGETTSPISSSTLRILRNNCPTKHSGSIKTLPERPNIKPNAKSVVSEQSSESQDVKIHTTHKMVMCGQSDVPHPTATKSTLSDSEDRQKSGKHASSDPASLSAVGHYISVSKSKDSQVCKNEEVAVNYSQMDNFMDLKSDQETSHACQGNNENSENKDNKQLRKCIIHGQSLGRSCEVQCHSRNTVDQVIKCSVCNTLVTSSHKLSQHMKQTQPDLLTSHCGECQVLFESQNALDQHRISHSAGPNIATEENLTCRDYGMELKSSSKYCHHRRKKHKSVTCGCDKCGLSFPYPSKLKLHLMSKHNATKPFMCEICGSSFAEKNMLTTHKNIHTGDKKYECPTCGRRFMLKTTLGNHMQTHLDRRPHTCNICGMGFKLSYYLKSHLKTHSETRERPHICSKCGAAFLKLAQLKNHERKHTGEKPYSCHVCSSHFSQLSSMKKHIKQIHEGVKPKDRFSCEYCGLSFTHSCKLKLHLMKHTGERPFSCNFCGCTYREKHQLNTHMKIHGGNEPFKCPFCIRRFLQKSSLEGHVRKHTGEKPFQCTVCFQSFSHKGYLRDHLKVHDENRERKYKCGICDKAFTCSSHMRSHEKLHNGDKPHKCDICGSQFTKRSSVKKHLKRTHGIQDATALQVQNCNIGSVVSEDAKMGMILPHMHPVDMCDQMEQQTDMLPGNQHQILVDTQSHRETQTDRSKECTPVENTETPQQLHSQLHLSHIHSAIRPEVLLDTRPQTPLGMCAGLHTVHSSLHHQIHQHPGIQILHPGLRTAVHLQGNCQMVPCMTTTLHTPVSQPENIPELLVYTMAT
ncbi:unnamed protein product [Candidula unifasciata]|uniref:C2H2-type domain-containing protein n=1 Tax=Candidula unifasciata TaxID=100452 RepID=A0A8S3YYB9_9EUPU|nr:unnamed protein product [Candidula unifasciata]